MNHFLKCENSVNFFFHLLIEYGQGNFTFVKEKSENFRNLWLWQPWITVQCAVRNLHYISVWSRARHCGIAAVWAKKSPSNTSSGSFWLTSNCVSKEKETREWNFSLCKIFLKQYFGLNFRRLKVKQEPKSREYDVHKRVNFPRSQPQALVWINGIEYVHGGHIGGVNNKIIFAWQLNFFAKENSFIVLLLQHGRRAHTL